MTYPDPICNEQGTKTQLGVQNIFWYVKINFCYIHIIEIIIYASQIRDHYNCMKTYFNYIINFKYHFIIFFCFKIWMSEFEMNIFFNVYVYIYIPRNWINRTKLSHKTSNNNVGYQQYIFYFKMQIYFCV